VIHEAQQLINDGHRTIILDMNYVDYIDAEGVWSLQEIYRKTESVNGSFSVINLRNQPKEVLGFTRLLTKLCNSK
jgi:anti-anti-sigma factor